MKRIIFNSNDDVIQIANTDEEQVKSWYLKGYIRKPKKIKGLWIAEISEKWRFSPTFRARK